MAKANISYVSNTYDKVTGKTYFTVIYTSGRRCTYNAGEEPATIYNFMQNAFCIKHNDSDVAIVDEFN